METINNKITTENKSNVNVISVDEYIKLFKEQKTTENKPTTPFTPTLSCVKGKKHQKPRKERKERVVIKRLYNEITEDESDEEEETYTITVSNMVFSGDKVSKTSSITYKNVNEALDNMFT